MKLFILALLLCPFAVSANELSEAPKPKADRRIFITGVSLLAASKSADFLTTAQLLGRGGQENNPLLGKHPSDGRISGYAALEFLGEGSVFYLTERSRHRWIRWTGRAYIGLAIMNHIELASCNSKLDPHSVAHHCRPIFAF
jgi:hypothetical protein